METFLGSASKLVRIVAPCFFYPASTRGRWAAPSTLPTLAMILMAFVVSGAQAATMTPKHPFTGAPDGSAPFWHLTGVQRPSKGTNAGTVYGVTQSGGANNTGAIFSYAVQMGPFGFEQYTLLGSVPTPGTPSSPLIQILPRPNGEVLLFGTTSDGGDYGRGTIYKYSSLTQTVTTVHSFSGTNCEGSMPEGSLATIGNHNALLVGTTLRGGCDGNGTIFTYNIGGAFSTVHSFGGIFVDGLSPRGVIRAEPAPGGVVHAVYGVVSFGGMGALQGGYIFKYDAFSNQLSAVCEFDPEGPGGWRPVSELKLGQHPIFQRPMLWGTTLESNDNWGLGTLFECDITFGSLSFLHHFAPDLHAFNAPVVLDATQNKLYGNTVNGIFAFDFVSGYSQIYQFPGGVYGSGSPGGLVPFLGRMWGVTPDGGTGRGSIFMFTP